MNIALAHGRNFEITTYGPEMTPWRRGDFYRAYSVGTIDRFRLRQTTFERKIKDGKMLNCVVRQGDLVQAVFGLTLHDTIGRGPFLNFLYFVGAGAAEVWEGVARFCLDAALRWKLLNQPHSTDPVWFRLKGRPGWRKILARMGVEIDGEWISSNQEYFRWAATTVLHRPALNRKSGDHRARP